ncbi:MAG TPA: UDP-N-acetylenolpyruvoylglucosamine reductase [Lachnospiraceae bacterium]|nr:UDP-N-acetylenolpyruvoylglucosamine reductase [Lachnospiraceae bacterium]
MIKLEQEPMSRHTTFRVGGPARYYLIPESREDVGAALGFARERELPFTVIGNGSNLLVSDAGFDGVVIEIGDSLSELTYQPAGMGVADAVDDSAVSEPGDADSVIVSADAGLRLTTMAKRLADMSLAGFEFAAGIPGTVGGAITMNAGAYDGEIKDSLVSVTVMDTDGQIKDIKADDLQLSYRHSVLQDSAYTVLSGTFCFNRGDADEIRGRIRELNERRREKQPLDYPSAGSTFKRPEGYFAGKLIQDAGLRGYSIGDAQVSEKHCGFIINRGAAAAMDIYRLIEYVREEVKTRFGVELVPEVRLVGDFDKA